MRDVPAKIINAFVNTASVSAQVLLAPQLALVATAKTKKYVAELQETKYTIQENGFTAAIYALYLPNDGVKEFNLVQVH